jgi:hypothetical protein
VHGPRVVVFGIAIVIFLAISRGVVPRPLAMIAQAV